jgi:molecular chaperone GrpE
MTGSGATTRLRRAGGSRRFRDLALRSQADFDNYKKRPRREKEEGDQIREQLALERLIAIVDNFELGFRRARRASIADLFG